MENYVTQPQENDACRESQSGPPTLSLSSAHFLPPHSLHVIIKNSLRMHDPSLISKFLTSVMKRFALLLLHFFATGLILKDGSLNV